jgi:hypothetical protein
MGEGQVRSHRRRLLASLVNRLLAPRSGHSVEEQIQAAADRYEADIRAAGARYESAMARILTAVSARERTLPDHEQAAAEHVSK